MPAAAASIACDCRASSPSRASRSRSSASSDTLPGAGRAAGGSASAAASASSRWPERHWPASAKACSTAWTVVSVTAAVAGSCPFSSRSRAPAPVSITAPTSWPPSMTSTKGTSGRSASARATASPLPRSTRIRSSSAPTAASSTSGIRTTRTRPVCWSRTSRRVTVRGETPSTSAILPAPARPFTWSAQTSRRSRVSSTVSGSAAATSMVSDLRRPSRTGRPVRALRRYSLTARPRGTGEGPWATSRCGNCGRCYRPWRRRSGRSARGWPNSGRPNPARSSAWPGRWRGSPPSTTLRPPNSGRGWARCARRRACWRTSSTARCRPGASGGCATPWTARCSSCSDCRSGR